jgi:outer membrane protein TolC
MNERDFSDLKKILELNEKRVSELQSRVKIGRSRKSELLTAQAQVFQIKAQLMQAESRARESQISFEQIIGVRPKIPLQTSCNLEKIKAPSLETALSTLAQNPNLESERVSFLAAKENLGFTKSAIWPVVDAKGNYFLHREGALEKVKWDALFTVTLNLFQGGIDRAKIAKSTAAMAEAEIRYETFRRSEEVELRRAHQQLVSLLGQYELLHETIKNAEENYREQSKDYGFGLSSNLDVLQSLNALQEARRSMDRVSHELCFQQLKLKVAMGEMHEYL